jgi:uncharacterized repeat protein (TIGR02543 family)
MNSLFERAQGAHRHSPSGWWRALLTALIAGALLLTGMGVLASSASATVMLPGANAAVWPSAWKAYALGDGTLVSDLNGDITPAGLDIVSGTCSPTPCSGPESSVYYKSDGTNAFFRMRMGADNVDTTKGGLASGDYLVQIANASGVVKAVVGVNGKTSSADYVYVTDSIGGTVTEVYEYPFTGGSPSSAGMRWIPTNDGTGQYFLDFQVPLSAIQTVSGGAITATTDIKLNYGSSMAANLATINKDNMLGSSTSADFTNVKPVKFVPSVYAVTFDSNGGSAVSPQNVDDGDPVVQPTAPTRSAYVFDGWWTAASGGTQWSFTTPITAATTLYAHWKNVWAVTFDSQGGSSVAPQSVVDGASATAPADPTRSGYFFDGWWTADSGGSLWNFASAVTAAKTLYAHWTIGRTVSFDGNGGSPVASQLVRDGDVAAAPADPTRAGYDFAGWFSDADPFSFTTPVTGDLALTAHWAKQVYTVSFDSNGGSAVADQSVEFEDLASEPTAPTRTGYDFVGWFAGDAAYDFATPVTGPLSLSAHWANQVHAVSFDSNGGSAVADQSVVDGDAADAPSDPTRTGYDFVGWFAGDDVYDFSSPVTGDLALTAHWAKQVYTVSFDSNGGSAVADQSVEFEDLASEPTAPIRTGYDFAGWFAGDDVYDFSSPVTGPLSLSAHWAKQVHTVSFDSNGGSAVADQSVAYGDAAVAPSDPTRAGYDFVGWFAGDDAYDFATPVTGPLSLTAHWAKQVYTVSFDSNGGSAVADQSVEFEDLASEPTAPTRTGYDFQGWFAGSDEYDFATPVTGAVALTAHWAKQVYAVSFDSDGGTAVAGQSVAYQNLASEPAAPTRTGYDFQGWFLGGSAYDFATPVTGGMTLTAHWAKQVYTVSFDSNGGSAVADQSVAYQDVAVAPSAPTRTGYDFQGWFLGGSAYDFTTPVTGGMTLTAHWVKQVYTVSFDANGGSAVASQSVAYQDLVSQPAAPTRTGHDFQGWFLGGSAYDFATPVTGGMTLTAHWAKHVYTVGFDTNGGSAVANQSVAYQEHASRPADPNRTGYLFQGWFIQVSGGSAYDFGLGVEHDLLLHARWTVADSDGDGVTDVDELAGANAYHCATDPRATDTDHDGLTDSQELKGIKMRVRTVTKTKTFRIGRVKTNPCRADTDRDGLKDGREVHGSKARHTHKRYKSNPLKKDSDRDRLSDKVEITGKANRKYGHVGSNPLNWDSDHGGVSDLGEIRAGSDPTSFASGPVNPRTVLPGLW